MRPWREFLLLLIITFLISSVWLLTLWSEGMKPPDVTFELMKQDLADYGMIFFGVDIILFYFIWRWFGKWRGTQKGSKGPQNIWERHKR